MGSFSIGAWDHLQGFSEPLHCAESVKHKALHITHMIIHTMYIDKHATLDALHFQPDATILKTLYRGFHVAGQNEKCQMQSPLTLTIH